MVVGLILGILYLFWDFLYWTKWIASIISLRMIKKQKRRFDNYDFEVENQPEKVGLLPPKEERILESPLPEETLEKAADEIFLYGVNSKSESLTVKITRCQNDESEAWVYLKLADGRCFELEQTKGYQCNFTDKCTAFTCGGLQMYYLSPMRRWRIVYCGMLRQCKSDEESESKSVFAKFTFIWTASSEIYDASTDFHVPSIAHAMAEAKWCSPSPPIHKAVGALNFYCQSGVVNGVVSIQDQPDIEMYLFGERIRYLGEVSYLGGCKFKILLGAVPETGLIIHLQKASIPHVLQNLYFGFIVHPNGEIFTIKDGIIISKMPLKDELEKGLSAMFKAERQYDLKGKFSGNEGHLKYEDSYFDIYGIDFEVDECKGSGYMLSGGISTQSSSSRTSIPRASSLRYKTKPVTVYFTDETSHLTELTGGKGSSLGKLTKLSQNMNTEFIVPKGIVVTTEAFEKFLTSQLIEKIENLKNVAYGNIKGDIQEACKIVQHAIESAHFPVKIKNEIEEKLTKLFVGNISDYKFAVRSSATGEDTDQMSAAGQMETFLGIKGLKEIFTAVKKCWASQFGYVAVEYKRQNGQILNSPMAVVIQEMVDCECSGVLFTADPVTNNPSVVVVTGNYGLGESVVSGSEEPDTVVLKRIPESDVEITSINVGLKQHRIVLKDTKSSEECGTVTEDVPDDKKVKCCISEEMALKLGKLSLKVERFFKSPRDIEWGIKNNSIYMLQSRPITTGGAYTDYEIKHELDAPLRSEKDFFTKCNVGEVMPGAGSPLGLEFISTTFSTVFQKKSLKRQQKKNFMQSKYFPNGLVPFYSQMHLDVIGLLTRMDDGDSISAQSMMIGVFGRMLDDPEMKTTAKHRRMETGKTDIRVPLIMIRDMFFAGCGIEAIKKEVFNQHIPVENGKTAKDIFNILMHSFSLMTKSFEKHFVCSAMSALWNMIMFSTLVNAKGGIDNDVYTDFAKLLASFSNVESADVPSAMQSLAQSITKETDSETFRNMPVEEAQEWLERSATRSSEKYRKFIERHGHRCLRESDLYSTPWRMNPKPLIQLLQNMTRCCEDAKTKTEERFSDILPRLHVPLNFKSRLLLKFLLPNCRRGIREREACKSNGIKAVDNQRKGYQYLSKAMVEEGYIPEKDLLFFLTRNEINDLLETRNPRLVARARHRRKLFPLLGSLAFPEISMGRPVPVNESEDTHANYEADLTMKGIPVSQGKVKGYARVAPTIKEASDLKRGEILITHSTDIAWSPFFPILGGVVTELGGLISHGAVVSREYGLPCVVGLHGATKQFTTGDYVLLDGDNGILQRISPPEN